MLEKSDETDINPSCFIVFISYTLISASSVAAAHVTAARYR